jgi:hypothetical protein
MVKITITKNHNNVPTEKPIEILSLSNVQSNWQ